MRDEVAGDGAPLAQAGASGVRDSEPTEVEMRFSGEKTLCLGVAEDRWLPGGLEKAGWE